MSEIKINATQWNAVSPEDQQKITEGLREAGSLRPEDVIVGDATIPEFTKSTQLEVMWNPLEDICKAACDVAAGTALAWCTANTAGIGLAACIAAAEVARKECKKRC